MTHTPQSSNLSNRGLVASSEIAGSRVGASGLDSIVFDLAWFGWEEKAFAYTIYNKQREREKEQIYVIYNTYTCMKCLSMYNTSMV